MHTWAVLKILPNQKHAVIVIAIKKWILWAESFLLRFSLNPTILYYFYWKLKIDLMLTISCIHKFILCLFDLWLISHTPSSLKRVYWYTVSTWIHDIWMKDLIFAIQMLCLLDSIWIFGLVLINHLGLLLYFPLFNQMFWHCVDKACGIVYKM